MPKVAASYLLVFDPWQNVIAGFFIANLLWSLVRYRFVSWPLASGLIDATRLWQWPAPLGSALYLSLCGNIGPAVLALF